MTNWERESDTHIFFWNGVFSNFTHAVIEYKDHIFQNTEQAFMWEKAMYFNDIEMADKILNTPIPGKAKALGRKVKNFNDEKWSAVSYLIMINVNLEKYKQHYTMREALLSTGSKIIVEASPYDKIWGIGLHWSDNNVCDESKWRGQNLLGKCLVEVRNELQSVQT